MSCRVLKRRVEEAVLATVAEAAREAGAARLIGDYLPSPKNAMVEEHFGSLGFSRAGSVGEGGTRWELALADYTPPDLPMVLSVQIPVSA